MRPSGHSQCSAETTGPAQSTESRSCGKQVSALVEYILGLPPCSPRELVVEESFRDATVLDNGGERCSEKVREATDRVGAVQSRAERRLACAILSWSARGILARRNEEHDDIPAPQSVSTNLPSHSVRVSKDELDFRGGISAFSRRVGSPVEVELEGAHGWSMPFPNVGSSTRVSRTSSLSTPRSKSPFSAAKVPFNLLYEFMIACMLRVSIRYASLQRLVKD